VRFLGWTSDLPTLYATFDICALSSINEGTPVALIEAMAAGTAVVSTNVGGVPDLIEDGVTGLLVAPRSVDDMADALVRLANDPELRSRLGMAARRAVVSYSADRLVNDIGRLYTEALVTKRR
jgi:glycosyltransferase involved in cell wall biosynthesis